MLKVPSKSFWIGTYVFQIRFGPLPSSDCGCSTEHWGCSGTSKEIEGPSQGGGHRGQNLPLRPGGPSGEETTKRYSVVCSAEAYHGKGISSLNRSRLRVSIASNAATNLRGPLGLRRMNLEAVGPSCGLLMPPTGP